MSDESNIGGKEQPPLYRYGVPNIERLKFLPASMIGLGPTACSEVAEAVAQVLDRPVEFVDEQGYERSIIAGAIDAEGKRLAWVEHKSKQLSSHVDVEFRLKAWVDGRIAIDWEVETYNPYFGCHVGYLAWHDQRLVIIYREKHHTYACTLSLDGRVLREEISDYWLVAKEQIACVSDRPDLVERLSIPDLAPLPDLDGEQARSEGVLPHGFSEINERRKEWAKRRKALARKRIRPMWMGSMIILFVCVAFVVILVSIRSCTASSSGVHP